MQDARRTPPRKDLGISYVRMPSSHPPWLRAREKLLKDEAVREQSEKKFNYCATMFLILSLGIVRSQCHVIMICSAKYADDDVYGAKLLSVYLRRTQLTRNCKPVDYILSTLAQSRCAGI